MYLNTFYTFIYRELVCINNALSDNFAYNRRIFNCFYIRIFCNYIFSILNINILYNLNRRIMLF